MLADSGAYDLRAAGDSDRERAWRRFYVAHFDMVYRMICRAGAPLTDAEDLAQKVFVTAHRRVAEGVEVERPGSWLRGIALRVVADHRRWRNVRRVKQWVVESVTKSEPPPPPDQVSEAAATQREVAAVLDKMSGKLRDVLVLTDIEGCKPAEAASILGIPVNTVRSRRRLAREDFERRWTKREVSNVV